MFKRLFLLGILSCFVVVLQGCPTTTPNPDPDPDPDPTLVAPTAAFTATPTAGMPPLTVLFADQSSPGSASIVNWGWDFGDGQNRTAQNPIHVYQSSGVYQVSLSVITSKGGDTETKVGYITVLGEPEADFSAQIRFGNFPLEVQFFDTSSEANAPTTAYDWDFGDGTTTSDVRNPIHTYREPGSYTVSLKVTTLIGESVAVKEDFISEKDPLQIDFHTQDFATAGAAQTALQGKQLYFMPDSSLSYYSRTVQVLNPAGELPVSTLGATPIDFAAGSVQILPAGTTMKFYGRSYATMYVSADGTVSFGALGNGNSSLENHFSSTQVSLFPVDASDEAVGTVSYSVSSTEVVVTFNGVDGSTFQAEFFIANTATAEAEDIALSYPILSDTAQGIVGLSNDQLAGLTAAQVASFLNGLQQSDLGTTNTGTL